MAAGGTLRYLLVRPVGRLRLLVAKFVGITAYIVFAVALVTITAYAVGVAAFGFGPDAEAGGAGAVTKAEAAHRSGTQIG